MKIKRYALIFFLMCVSVPSIAGYIPEMVCTDNNEPWLPNIESGQFPSPESARDAGDRYASRIRSSSGLDCRVSRIFNATSRDYVDLNKQVSKGAEFKGQANSSPRNIDRFVDDENSYWINDSKLFSLDKNNLPLSCAAYVEASTRYNPNQPLAFQQITNSGERFILIWPKSSMLWQSVPSLQNQNIFTPYTAYFVQGSRLTYTLNTHKNVELVQVYQYDSKNTSKRYLIEFRGPPPNQSAVFANNEAIKDAKKQGMPGKLQIRCTGSLNNF